MEKLKIVIQKILLEKSSIDWLIVHDISKLNPGINDIEFSFVEGKERIDEPFRTNQGYITLKTNDSIMGFAKIITELHQKFKSDSIALANLFIIISRASYKDEDRGDLIKNFKQNLGKDTCQNVYNLLINSLNSEYYKYHNIRKENPSNTNEWLDLFHSTQYLHGFSDPLLTCLQLVRSEKVLQLDFKWIDNMKPLLRSVLMGWYGFDLKISKEKLKQLYGNEKELTFLSACLIDDSTPDKSPPEWLSESLVKIFLEKYWNTIGKHVFIHVFGLSYRNKNQNELYKTLEDLIHVVLWNKLTSEQIETTEWINKLEFPDEFIALFSWFSIKKLEYNKILNSNKSTILIQFINELQRISKALPVYLASENSSDPFSSFQLHDLKYQNILAHMLFLLVFHANVTTFKNIADICYEFKPLFYGGYRARSLASHFTELMLLIGLSGNSIKGMKDNEFKSLERYLKIIADTVLIPYIHIIEREDEFWNPESEKAAYQYNAGQHLISMALSDIRKHEAHEHYQKFFKIIDNIKVAQWPYERS